MRAFFAALEFLTVFPRPKGIAYTANEAGPAAIFFPVVGFLLGAILALVNIVLESFSGPALASVTLVAILALLTRGLHLDGLADTFDGLGAGADRERALTIMDDSHTGAFGAIAIALLLFFKIHGIEVIESERWRALLTAPMLGRWAMVLLAYRSRSAKPGLGSMLVDQLKSKHFIGASLVAAVFAAAILRALGVAILLWVALFTLAAKKFLHRRLGGVSGDTFGAVGELSETSVFVLLAWAAR
jgi:adenosylcobinamide-GDP ribazoletransferase